MDVFNMTYVKNATVHKLKKHPVYKDKSDSRRKVVIVRRTLISNFIIRTIFRRFWYMIYYCRPTIDPYKKTLLKYCEKTVKNSHIIAIICITSEHSSFEI